MIEFKKTDWKTTGRVQYAMDNLNFTRTNLRSSPGNYQYRNLKQYQCYPAAVKVGGARVPVHHLVAVLNVNDSERLCERTRCLTKS